MKPTYFFLDYYKTDFKIIQSLGGWLITEKTKNLKLWKIYLFTVNIAFALLLNLLQVLHLFEMSSLLEVVHSGYLIAVACMGSVKAYFLFKNRTSFLLLIEYMQEDIFLPRNRDQNILAMKALNMHKKVKYVLTVISSFSVLGSMITPMFSYQDRRLIFSAWYPFDLTPMSIYIWTYLHQVIADVFISYMNIYTDVIVAGFTTFIGIQCDFLCYNLINMNEDDLDNELRICVQHHKSIMRFAKTTEKVFSQIYFGQFAASTAALCMTLFLLTLVERASFEFFYLVLYQSSMFSLLLIPCWFSSEMERKSENIPNAAYSCPWVNASQPFKKELLYFIHIAQTPISLYAVGLFHICVETFMKILRSSFSYYTVLNNLNMQN